MVDPYTTKDPTSNLHWPCAMSLRSDLVPSMTMMGPGYPRQDIMAKIKSKEKQHESDYYINACEPM